MKSFYEFSKSLQFHLENKIPLSENVFRYGSQSHFDLINEARSMQDSLDLSDVDKEILSTDIGTFGVYEGKEVPLDLPFLEEGHVYSYKDWGVMDPKGKIYPPEKADRAHVDIFLRLREKIPTAGMKGGWIRWYVENNGEMYVEGEYVDKNALPDIVNGLITLIKFHKNCETYYVDIKLKNKRKVDRFVEGNYAKLISVLKTYKNHQATSESLDEAKYQGKEVELGKPHRGGPKKFFVYVKNKNGNVIKVAFGDTGGLKAKINDPKARKSFVARHKCDQKKDKTSPGYWACRLPYYAKSLGLSGGGNFFW